MIELAHIRNGQIVKRYSGDPPRGWVIWLDGSRTGVAAGLTNGDERVVVVESVTNDTSTGSNIVKTVTETIEADRVLFQTDIRDKTQAEIDADATSLRQRELARAARLNSLDRAQFEMIFNMENRIRTLEGRPTVTKQDFIAYVEGKMQ